MARRAYHRSHSECRQHCSATALQRAASQYDHIARLSRTRPREGCDPRPTAARDRRHPPAGCPSRVVAPTRDARPNSLINRAGCTLLIVAPRGIGVARLRDAPAEWSRQYAMLGLSHPYGSCGSATIVVPGTGFLQAETGRAKWPARTERSVSETGRSHATAPIRGNLHVSRNAPQIGDCVVADAVDVKPVS